MGGRLRGHRVMVTVPEDLWPVLSELAELMGLPVASLIRQSLQESSVQLVQLRNSFRSLKEGNQGQAVLGFTASLIRAHQLTSKAFADTFEEASELMAPVVEQPAKKPRKAYQRKTVVK